ncbi:peptidoglycan-binding protein [Sporolactobacillus pectinivorans]|uniref:peptidoglycan-binding protein n=1 Tax=Sporolactobacillus pectinivorans TaxID=1591408 RepID=UPI000C265FC4|nr:peptidoglycan-binding protein [Sporolactobacillus pectinivorans]
MLYGSTIAKSAAVAATFTSSFFILPSYAAAHLINDDSLLYKGMNNEDIRTVQSILKATGQYSLRKETGYFGSATEKAVKQFQSVNGIQVDGIVGTQTKQALISAAHRQMNLLSVGSIGEDVKYLQTYLQRFGYYDDEIDGIFGIKTEHAVIVLQKGTNIAVDGIVGPITWGSIEKLSMEQNKGQATRPKTMIKAPSEARQSHIMKRPVQKQIASVREFYANSTAYTARCAGCSGTTATGINLLQNPDTKVVAVDPSVIPLGTKLYVEGYGYAVAGDTGGAIKGRKIDVFFNDNGTALQWGRRTVKVKILN